MVKKAKYIDLHTHSIYSDGEKTPQELIEIAKQKNVGIFSLTDHDTILGVKELIKNYNDPDIKIVTGVEMTGYIEHGRLHILGYDFDIENEKLNKTLDKIHNFSINKVRLIIEFLLKEFNIMFNDDELNILYNPIGDVGRPDIAKLLIKHNYVQTVEEAFVKYLNFANDQVKDKQFYLTAKEIINLIEEAKGISVLAHPISLKMNLHDLENYICDLAEEGLIGIEVFHSEQPNEFRLELLKIANRYGLLVTGGSDYHGPIVKPDVEIATGLKNNVCITNLPIEEIFMKR